MARLLSEYESKQLLAEAGIRVPPERLVATPDEAERAAAEIGYPVALKLCGEGIAHKTERGLVRLGLRDRAAVRGAAIELLAERREGEEAAGVLVAPLVRGTRELIVGSVRDPQFGPCVMLGIGGILAEALHDVVFAAAPIDARDAEELIEALANAELLGPLRGEPAVDRDALAEILQALGELTLRRDDIRSIDVNPLLICEGAPTVVDALVELEAVS